MLRITTFVPLLALAVSSAAIASLPPSGYKERNTAEREKSRK
jgi:hypothetical protein